MLAREGLARVDEYNATPQLKEAEAAAKREKKNVSWPHCLTSDIKNCLCGNLTRGLCRSGTITTPRPSRRRLPMVTQSQ